MRHVFLDSSPLGILSHPAKSQEVIAITQWSVGWLAAGHRIYIAEVIDYEIRRELLRAGKTSGVNKLDALKTTLRYLPIATDAMLFAAELWARSRRSGTPTGDPKRLDIDVILAAQALTAGISTADLIVATTNVGHLTQFVPADHWTNIKP